MKTIKYKCEGRFVRMALKAPVMIAMALFCHNSKALPTGETNILSGPATWVEGAFHEEIFSPGTPQILKYDGNWHAIISDKGIQVEASNSEQGSVVSIIGEDQFVLKTRGTFQEGFIRTMTNNSIVGPDVGIYQFIYERIVERNKSAIKQNPTYAWSWEHFIDDLEAGSNSGLHVQRLIRSNSVEDKWYISRYLESLTPDGDKVVTTTPIGYSTNGFLALVYKANIGEITNGETLDIQEYRAKPDPKSDEDVNLIWDTKIFVSSVKPVVDVNLLPVVNNSKTETSDYRLMKSDSSEPIIADFSDVHWITRNSPTMDLLKQIPDAVPGDSDTAADVTGNKRAVVVAISVFAATTGALILFIRAKRMK